MGLIEKKHLGIYAIVTIDNKIVLVKKSRGPYTGKWDLPGGLIKHGENLLQALLRELKEELDLTVFEKDCLLWDNTSINFTYLDNNKEISFFHVGLIYRIEHFDKSQINLNIQEEDIQGAKWIPFNTDLDVLSPLAQFVFEKI